MRKFLATRKPSAKVTRQETDSFRPMKLRSFAFSLALCLPLWSVAAAPSPSPKPSPSPLRKPTAQPPVKALPTAPPAQKSPAPAKASSTPAATLSPKPPTSPKSSPTPKPAPSLKPDVELDNVADEFIRGYLAARPLHATALGFHEYDGRISEYTRLAIDAEVARLKRFDDRLNKFDLAKLSPPGGDRSPSLTGRDQEGALFHARSGHLRAQPDELRQRHRRERLRETQIRADRGPRPQHHRRREPGAQHHDRRQNQSRRRAPETLRRAGDSDCTRVLGFPEKKPHRRPGRTEGRKFACYLHAIESSGRHGAGRLRDVAGKGKAAEGDTAVCDR